MRNLPANQRIERKFVLGRKNQRNDFEDLCLTRLKALLPEGVIVTILADRGCGDVKLFEFLGSLGLQYDIRYRGDIHVSAAAKRGRPPNWVGKGGRARKLRDAEITAARHKVGAVVCVKAAGMKEPWHLADSDGSLSAPQIIKLYSKRWTIELRLVSVHKRMILRLESIALGDELGRLGAIRLLFRLRELIQPQSSETQNDRSTRDQPVSVRAGKGEKSGRLKPGEEGEVVGDNRGPDV